MDDEEYLNINPNHKGKSVGHNSLNLVVEEAKKALSRIQRGEVIAWEGWREYGVALNVGRGEYPSDEEFGQWVVSEGLDKFVTVNLTFTKYVNQKEREAAMWIASSPEEEQQALLLFPNARTPRGLHAKWKEHEKKLEEEEENSDLDEDSDDTSDSDNDENDLDMSDDCDDAGSSSGTSDKPSNVTSLRTGNKSSSKPKGSGGSSSFEPVAPPKADIGLIASSMFGVVTNVQTFKELSGGNPTTKQIVEAIIHEIKHVHERKTEKEIQDEIDALKETITLVSQALDQMTNNVTPLSLVK